MSNKVALKALRFNVLSDSHKQVCFLLTFNFSHILPAKEFFREA